MIWILELLIAAEVSTKALVLSYLRMSGKAVNTRHALQEERERPPIRNSSEEDQNLSHEIQRVSTVGTCLEERSSFHCALIQGLRSEIGETSLSELLSPAILMPILLPFAFKL